MNAPAWTIKEVRGAEAESFVEALASLRIRVFRDFPYLYDGDMDYERKYLRTYFQSKNSFVALCFAHNTLVGASTAIHLPEAEKEFVQPFVDGNIDPGTICYFGESVLLPELRGKGIGREFMKARERFSLTLPKVSKAAFCSVVRSEANPLEAFWIKTGFKKVPELSTTFSWKEIGQAAQTPKLMQFWLKELKENQ